MTLFDIRSSGTCRPPELTGFHQPWDRQRGIALVFVLWLVAGLSVLIASFHVSLRTSLYLARNEFAVAEAEVAVRSGVEIAASRLIETDKKLRWVADGSERSVSVGPTQLTIRIHDENGRINLNRADPKVIAGLFRIFLEDEKIADTLADRVADWRDVDEDRRTLGAEQSEYRSTGPSELRLGTGDQAFEHVSQLKNVLEFPATLAERVAPFVTLHSANDKVNPLSASATVLRALPGVTRDMVTTANALRENGADAATFTSAFGTAATFLDAKSGPAYRITVQARGEGILALGQVETVIVLNVDKRAPYRILDWQYHRRPTRAQSTGQNQ